MKKYFIASVVAVMAFAFAAFAASFTINDSVLAAGSADVNNCGSDDLTVVSWGAESSDLTVRNVVLRADDLAGCGEDEVVIVRLYNENGGEVARQAGEITVAQALAADSNPNRARVALRVGSDSTKFPSIEDIESMHIVIHTKTA